MGLAVDIVQWGCASRVVKDGTSVRSLGKFYGWWAGEMGGSSMRWGPLCKRPGTEGALGVAHEVTGADLLLT